MGGGVGGRMAVDLKIGAGGGVHKEGRCQGGPGSRVQGPGFRVQGSGFRVQSLGLVYQDECHVPLVVERQDQAAEALHQVAEPQREFGGDALLDSLRALGDARGQLLCPVRVVPPDVLPRVPG